MYALVIYENGRIQVLARAETESELRGMWASARHAVIAQGGTVVAVKPGTATQAAAELRTAVRLGVDGPAAPLANPLRGVPVTRDRSVVREKPEEGDEAEETKEEEEEPEPPPPPRAQKPTPAPSTPTCTRPGCERHTRQATRPGSADPALSVLCDVCKASAYRLMRERGVPAADAVAEMQRTPRGQAPMMKVPAPRTSTAPARPAQAPTPAAHATPLGEVLAEAREAMELCRRYGGVAAVRAVMEQLDAWRREAA